MIPTNRNTIVNQIGQNEVTRTYKVDNYNKLKDMLMLFILKIMELN